MSINLLTTVQEQLHYPALQKIDPNTQAVKEDSKAPNEERFSQAAIPSAILALYKFSTTTGGAEKIIEADAGTDWPLVVFADNKNAFLDSIATYSYHSAEATAPAINKVFNAVVAAINQNQDTTAASADTVKKLLADQRNLVLPFLPAELQLGTLLNDNALDDRTNKMEGPMSNLMHSIGNIFSSSDEEKVAK